MWGLQSRCAPSCVAEAIVSRSSKVTIVLRGRRRFASGSRTLCTCRLVNRRWAYASSGHASAGGFGARTSLPLFIPTSSFAAYPPPRCAEEQAPSMSSSATVPPHYFSPTPSTSAFVPMHAAHLSWTSTATGSGHGGVDELPAQTNRRASRAPPVPSKPPAFKRASVGPSGLAARARDAAQPARALLQRLSKAPPPLPPRASLAGPAHDLVRSQTPTSNAQPSSARQISASFSSSLANKFHAVASRELTLKERLAAGAGIGIEWGRKGKERVTGWQSSGGTRWVPGSSGGTGWTASTSVMHVLGVRAPRKTGMAFGVELATVLKLPTAVREESAKRRDMHDPVQGALAQRFLPAIAARCLEYLGALITRDTRAAADCPQTATATRKDCIASPAARRRSPSFERSSTRARASICSRSRTHTPCPRCSSSGSERVRKHAR